jgi:hypothetical protein
MQEQNPLSAPLVVSLEDKHQELIIIIYKRLINTDIKKYQPATTRK